MVTFGKITGHHYAYLFKNLTPFFSMCCYGTLSPRKMVVWNWWLDINMGNGVCVE